MRSHSQSQTVHDKAEGIHCPACSSHFGFDFKTRVTILPLRTHRGADGEVSLDGRVVVCAECQKRGVTTRL